MQVAEWLALRAEGQDHEERIDFTDIFKIDVYNDSPSSIAKQLLKMAQVFMDIPAAKLFYKWYCFVLIVHVPYQLLFVVLSYFVYQDAGVAAVALSEVLPTSLSSGHGDQACIFLNLLADVAIHKTCKKQAMVYPSDVVEDNGSSELNDDDEEEVGVIEVE